MANLGQNFDSNQYGVMSDRPDPVPAGEYLMKIVKSELKPTNAGTGKYVSFEMDIIQGEYKGRKVWANINLINPNPITVEIAQKELATICRACGKSAIQDTNEVHNIPFTGNVKFIGETPKKGGGVWPQKNEMGGYADASGGGTTQQQAETQTTSEDSVDPGWD